MVAMAAQTSQVQSINYAQHLQRLQQPCTARPSRVSAINADDATPSIHRHAHPPRRRGQLQCRATMAVEAPATPAARTARGHAELLHGLGEVGDIAPTLMPWLLRLAHIL